MTKTQDYTIKVTFFLFFNLCILSTCQKKYVSLYVGVGACIGLEVRLCRANSKNNVGFDILNYIKILQWFLLSIVWQFNLIWHARMSVSFSLRFQVVKNIYWLYGSKVHKWFWRPFWSNIPALPQLVLQSFFSEKCKISMRSFPPCLWWTLTL